jgi:C-terminal processing protease CtpA/Prc
VFRSRFGRWVTLGGVASLVCAVFVSNAVWADDADDLASAITTHIRERLGSSGTLSPADESHVSSFTHYILKTFYYPVNIRDLLAAAATATDLVDPPTDGTAMAQAAMTGVVNALGHDTRMLTTIGADIPQPGTKGGPALHAQGSVRVITLPTMNIFDPNTRHTCADFMRYIDTQDTDGVSGYVLDLRGNEGGPLTDSSCLVGYFMKAGETIFQVINKQGSLVKYQSEANSHKPTKLPLVVVIDAHTDNGALLVAAVLRDQHRAGVIGELNPSINGGVSSLVFPPGVNRAVVLPTGEILLPDKRPLAGSVHIDVTMPVQDDAAMLDAARALLAKQPK